MDKNKNPLKILLLGMMIILGLATVVYGVIYIASSLNPMVSTTLPILVLYQQHFRENATSISLVLGETQNNTFVFHENITLKPYLLGYSPSQGYTYFYESLTAQRYSSDQTIQLSTFINGTKYGVTLNFTLPRIHLYDMESPSRSNKTEKYVVNAFYIRLDPTQTYTKVSFWFTKTIAQ